MEKMHQDLHIKPKENLVVYAPDRNAMPRATVFADLFGDAPIGGLSKRRPAKDVVEIYVLEERKLDDMMQKFSATDVRGKVVLIRDDIYGTGGTLRKSANVLKDMGAKAVYGCITHLDLCKGSDEYENIKKKTTGDGIIIFGTNSVPHALTKKEKTHFILADIAPLLAELIDRRTSRRSISKFFGDYRSRIEDNCHAY